ncbi:hypothetical protein RT717_01065 [Imperialibacter roseus]|uniref:DUF4382 domain-containing protein n=1 Tax=Imperialibacter roseus TaxID=1324217 RepID=A0ABZ0ITB3_9BACT|nr:hypothetical protein [Imperialibacter roseus]WOK07210.1 hypothetical protein RT717_01065 [Imperialibacter roseus]
MKRTILVALMAFAVVLIQSCGEDENIPTGAQTGFEMRAVTGTTGSTSGRVANTGYTFTEVFAGVTEIELETLEDNLEEEENGEDENEEVEFEGNFVINLLTGTSEPDFGLSELLAGVYQEVEVEFENILEGDKTLIVNFNFTAEGATEPTYVEFSTSEEFELEIENEAGFVLDGGTVNSILVTLDLEVLFASIDFSSLVADEDGVIRINENSNSDLMHEIVEKLEEALEAEEEDEDDEDENDED